MVVFDDKYSKAIRSGNQLLIPFCHCPEDITFKASYVVSGDLSCEGKVTSLFDLTVFGDVHADEIDVKGRFVCMGHCIVSRTIVVQNDIWGEDIQAPSITCHDRIVAQSLDANTVLADGSIIIGKTLSIETVAQTNQNVICGETAYGAGKIVASSVLTAEPIDLDDGEEALSDPFHYSLTKNTVGDSVVSKESAKYSKRNDYSGYISSLMKKTEKADQNRLKKYLTVLRAAELADPDFSGFRDVSLLIWLIDLSKSDYFKDWDKVTKWTEAILYHFQSVAEGKVANIFQGKPADKLLKGYTVFHNKFGVGVVQDAVPGKEGTHSITMVTINFDDFGLKKFTVPDSLKFFSILSETSVISSKEFKKTLLCEVNGYEEWLFALRVINENKEYLGESLHNAIFDLLIDIIGLKAKFVKDRFNAKGWS